MGWDTACDAAPWGGTPLVTRPCALSFGLWCKGRLMYSKTRQVKKVEVNEPTFQPALSEKTHMIAEARRSKQPQSLQMQLHVTPPTDVKLEGVRRELRDREMAECTFSPAINNRGQAGRVSNRRYMQEMEKRKMEKKCQPSWSSIQDRELQECTFKPTINTSKSYKTNFKPTARHKGEEKVVERLKAAQQERDRVSTMKDIRYIEDVNKGWEKREKTTKAAPFNLTAKGSKRKPELYIDVQLGGGRKGRIGVCRGDQPDKLAANFARVYALDADVKKQLVALIETRIQELNDAHDGVGADSEYDALEKEAGNADA
ncbi:hypothetical protein CYMTET_33077 [Cymbomonas tetramitiformis]|uniref:Uncharacterized protein n=1 Tax=Cymbomonas tetramitiformis TaxID=36881 RepID=A0AAE0KRB0_9CHLO|nr:hypothetical protein CYMTET_33077 [Cymbomonas tetramitiformis]